jgi:hypothetical protein
VLLDLNFEDIELADAIVSSFKDKYLHEKMKEMALVKWNNCYNPEKNYKKFYEFIQSFSS